MEPNSLTHGNRGMSHGKLPGAPLGAKASVSRETLCRLEAFADLLCHWGTRMNLVSQRDLAMLWPRHIEDALQLVPLLPAETATAVDLGSGAGFPGVVLAIATGIEFHLIEADQRKAAFLREAARVANAPLIIHSRRIEDTHLRPASLITARALAPLPKLLHYAAAKLTPDGICLFPRGSSAESELTKAHETWTMSAERIPSRTDPKSVILRIREIARAQSRR